MWRFGEDWLWNRDDGDETPLELFDKRSGEPIRPLVIDETTGDAIDVRRVRLRVRAGREDEVSSGAAED